MKASEIILDSELMTDTTRGEALELLCDLVFEHYGSNNEQMSNGAAIDAILQLFDQLIEDDHDAEIGLIASIEKATPEGWEDD